MIKRNMNEKMKQIKAIRWTELACRIPGCKESTVNPPHFYYSGVYSSGEICKFKRDHIRKYHDEKEELS